MSTTPAGISPATETLEPTPELTISRATNDELIPAHKLIADSVAQQRAILVRSLLYSHPHLSFPPFVLLLAWIYSQNSNPGTALLLGAGCVIAMLSLCGRLSDGYIEEAEKVGSGPGYTAMMESGREVVVARWGPEVIGVAVVEMVKEGRGGMGVVWALAVRLKYRRHGIGKGLLDEVVKAVRKRFGDDADVVFADAHINSYRIGFIPKVFNKVFDKLEAKVRTMLEAAKKAQPS